MDIAIINYDLGNLKSVHNAIAYLGHTPYIAETPKEMENASHIILPGVGAFGEGMQILHENGWVEPIKEQVFTNQKPFLGICLGMQLLAEKSFENGEHKGLGLVSGTVEKLTTTDKSVRIPHIGWSPVTQTENKKMYDGLESGHDFYFVHSYAMKTDDNNIVSGTCHHGQEFIASIEQDNVWGAQFHPEKSQKAGLHLLKNFLSL